jgi:hypothetical protein
MVVQMVASTAVLMAETKVRLTADLSVPSTAALMAETTEHRMVVVKGLY